MSEKIQLYFNPEIVHNIKVIPAKDGNRDIKLISPCNVVNMGDLIGKIVSEDTPKDENVVFEGPASSFKPGINVVFDREKKIYVSKTYGFVLVINNTICIDTPLLINDLKSKAVLLLYPNHFNLWPSLDDLIAIFNHEQIVQTVPFESMRSFLDKLRKSKPRLVKMLIAKGREPVKGIKAYNKLLIETEKKAGKIRDDGSMDFYEQDSVIRIKKGQLIGEAIAGVKAQDGIDVFGNKILADSEENTNYLMGKNIERRGNEFYSSVEGVLLLDDRKVSVSEVLIIEGDVDFHQGNIDFSGTVHVMKNVLAGFKVVAGGDIIIEGNVDDATIQAGGNVTIKKGVISQTGKTLIEAKGNIKAKYIMDSEVTSEKDVIIDEYLSNCNVIAYENVILTSKKGQIIGGEVMAKYKIEAVNLGSKGENPTKIIVGKDPVIEGELRIVTKEWEDLNKEFKEIQKEIKHKWDEKYFQSPEEYIQGLKSDQREKFVPVAKRYGEVKEKVDKLDEKRKELTAELKFDPPPKIIVHNTAYGGVILHIYNSVKKIEDKYTACVFKEENKEITSHPIS